MFDAPPRETRWRSWLWVALWSLGIFASIPLARAVEKMVRASVGQAAFGWFVIGVVSLATLGAVLARPDRGARSERGSTAWLVGIALVFVALTASLWRNPEEAVHFVQYGGLALLLHRALAHSLHDSWIYWVGALVGGLVGCLDETIQWTVPKRYFGWRDLQLNLFASAWVQLGIARGLRPPYIATGFSARGRLAFARAAIGWLAALLFFALNTPQRVVAYAERVPGLAFLADNESAMAEYGYRHEALEFGVFRSRLTLDELRQQDEARASEVASILDEHRDDPAYYEFLVRYPPQRDAFLHELRVHLFRRDRYARFAGRNRADPIEFGKLATIALRENRIVEAHFGRSVAASSYRFDTEQRAEFEAVLRDEPYESSVSHSLITRVSEGQTGFLLVAALALALAAERRGARLERARGSE
jgi:hypothetical protein